MAAELVSRFCEGDCHCAHEDGHEGAPGGLTNRAAELLPPSVVQEALYERECGDEDSVHTEDDVFQACVTQRLDDRSLCLRELVAAVAL